MSTLLSVKNLRPWQTSHQIKVVNFLTVTYIHYSIKINLKYDPEGRRYRILADILNLFFMKFFPWAFEGNLLLFVNDGLSCSQGKRQDNRSVSAVSANFHCFIFPFKRISFFPAQSLASLSPSSTENTLLIFYWMLQIINKEGQISVNVWTLNIEMGIQSLHFTVSHLCTFIRIEFCLWNKVYK